MSSNGILRRQRHKEIMDNSNDKKLKAMPHHQIKRTTQIGHLIGNDTIKTLNAYAGKHGISIEDALVRAIETMLIREESEDSSDGFSGYVSDV